MRDDILSASKYIGIDLGTANTLVYTAEKGIVTREPSVVAFDSESSRVLAVGDAAKRMIGKTPASVSALRPLRGGVIADFEFCSDMLCEFVKKGVGQIIGIHPKVIMGIPYGITEVEKRAAEDAAIEAGASGVITIDEPLLAAIGASLPVMSPIGNMIVDIGAGTTEIAVISQGGIVNSSSVKIAGNTFDNAIISYIKQEFNVLIGEQAAEEIKIKIGSAHPTTDIGAIEVKGRNMRNGRAAEFTLYASEVREALSEALASLFEAIRAVLDAAPPEICSDIYDTGITLCGGGALLSGISFYIQEKSKLQVRVANKPLDCVINGIGRLIKDKKMLDEIERIGLRD